MYSPVKDDNKQTRMNDNPNKYIIKGRRKIKTNEEIKKFYKPLISK